MGPNSLGKDSIDDRIFDTGEQEGEALEENLGISGGFQLVPKSKSSYVSYLHLLIQVPTIFMHWEVQPIFHGNFVSILNVCDIYVILEFSYNVPFNFSELWSSIK